MLTALLLLSPAADAATWAIDPAHTKVGFRVEHMKISSVEGTFHTVSGTLEAEPGATRDLSVEVEVDLASVDTGNDKRDEHLRASDFLDVASHPTMTFASTQVKKTEDGFDIFGELTLRGVTKPVTLHAAGLTESIVDPWGGERMGATATATVDRHDFGVSWNQALEAGGMLVGSEVELRIDVEFVKSDAAKMD
jgi:polyisoprenoid-binding protein YceI